MRFRIFLLSRVFRVDFSARCLALLVSLSFLMLMALAACRRNPASAPPGIASSGLAADSGGYTGSDACAACHPTEFQLHSGTRHAHTMRAAQPAALGALTPAAGSVPLAGYGIGIVGGQLALTRAIAPIGPVPLSLALGSGKVGVTFVSIQGADALLEARMSYFPEGRQWDITPGQQDKRDGDSVFGRPKRGDEARRCLACHSVTLPVSTITPEPRFYGVGCESCHGPGKAHIESIRAGNRQPSASLINSLKGLPPAKLNDVCGKCHRTLKDIDIQSPEGSQTHRFQPYALTRSRCRNKDGSVLSCMTCHAPHADVSTNVKAYETVCLTCHSATPAAHALPTHAENNMNTGASKDVNTGKACPVNPKAACISCHMRARQSFPGLFWKPMVDHLIAVPPKSRAVASPHSAGS